MITKADESSRLNAPDRKRDSFGEYHGVGIPAQYGKKDGGYMEVNVRDTPVLSYKMPTKLN